MRTFVAFFIPRKAEQLRRHRSEEPSYAGWQLRNVVIYPMILKTVRTNHLSFKAGTIELISPSTQC
jgi:hypothetical protein